MRRRVPTLALALALCGGSRAAAEVIVGAEPPGEPREVRFEPDVRPDPCVTWNVLAPLGQIIRVAGHPAASCPSEPQSVLLPGLAAGRYTLVAYLSTTGEVWEKARFTVGLPVALHTVLVDLPAASPAPDEPEEIVVTSVSFGLNDSLYFNRPPSVEEDRIVFHGESSFCPITCTGPIPVEFRGNRFVLPPLSAGLKVVELETDGFVWAERAFTVAPPPAALALHDGRFEVALEWRDRAGAAHAARAETLTTESGRFWVFGRENVELTIKILDGRAINGAFWLFAASMTDLAWTLTVVDRNTAFCGPQEPCPRFEVYRIPAGENGNVIDLDLFHLLPPS